MSGGQAGTGGPTRRDRYVAERKAQEAANGTINRELTTLRRAFRLAKKLKRVATVPEIAMLAEATPRQGFLEHAEFLRLLSHLPNDLRAPLEAAYITGLAARFGSLELDDPGF